jgi:PAS domain S-box-containing protein
LFRDDFNIEAVGIRLKEGYDFPYFVTIGFPEKFIMLENKLCSYNNDRTPIRDNSGNPLLDCMCGNVLCGRFDPGKSFFSENGSYWTNSTTELLATTTERDRLTRTRNRCNSEGYESVAIIPLKFSGVPMGLLQLNDHSRNRFTAEFINFSENICRYLAIAVERIMIEEELEKKEANIRTIIESNTDGSIWLIDNSFRLLVCNSVFLERFEKGIGRKIEAGDNVIDGLSESVKTDWISYYRRGLAGEHFTIQSAALAPFDHMVFRYNFNPVFNREGKVTRLAVIGHNISDLLFVQEELGKSEERYRVLSEHGGIGIGLYSYDGEILFFNNKALQNLDGRLEDYIGKNLITVFGEEAGNNILRRVRLTVDTGESYDYEDFFESPSGKYWFLSNHTAVYDSAGDLMGVQVLAHDITKRKKAELDLQESEHKYSNILRDLNKHIEEAREKERSEISLNLHDDLGQKLTALKMDISWIKKRMEVSNTALSDKFTGIERLIDDSVEFIQKISAEMRPAILFNLGLPAAVEWLLGEFKKSSGISGFLKISPPDFLIDTEVAVVLYRIIQESVTNVIRHSKAEEIFITISDDGSQIRMTIEDNGTGMDSAVLNNPKSLGLIGMRERARACGGEFTIESSPGKGTTLNVILPAGNNGTYKIFK